MSKAFYESRAVAQALRQPDQWRRVPTHGESEPWGILGVVALTPFVAEGGIYVIREVAIVRYVGFTSHPLALRLMQHQRAESAGAVYWDDAWTVTLQPGDRVRERVLIEQHQPFFNELHTDAYRAYRQRKRQNSCDTGV